MTDPAPELEPPRPSAQRNDTRRTRAIVLTIVLAALVAFWPVLRADFTIWDDQYTVYDNPRLRPPTLAGVAWHWRHPYMDLYVPLTYTVWGAVAAIAQEPVPADDRDPGAPPVTLRPGLFHAANLALHIGAAMIVFVLLRRLFGAEWAACAGALLFALHPVQVEPVAWVSGLKDVLAGLLSLAAVWQYVVFVQASAPTMPTTAMTTEPGTPKAGGGARRHLAAALIALALATLAKPVAVVVPFVAAAIDHLVLGRSLKDVARGVAPLVAVVVPCLVWTKLVQPAPHVVVDPRWWTRLLVAGDALAFYFYKLVWPAHLGVDYGRTPAAVLATWWAQVAWLVPAIVLIALIALRRRSGVPLAAALVFIAGVLPVLGLVPFDFQEYSTVADHYLYISMLGPALLLAWLLARQRPGRGRTVTAALVAVVLVILGARCHAQARHWRNTTTLFEHALAINPRSWAALDNLGMEALGQGRIEEGERLVRQALAINPHSGDAYINLGYALVSRGDVAGAIAAFETAVELMPRDPEAHANLAGAYGTAGRLDEAIEAYEQTLRLDPDHRIARRMLPLTRQYRQTLRSRPPTTTRPAASP